ncbi:putative C-mannosyltransferase DPY19L3 [Arapaima gigas]
MTSWFFVLVLCIKNLRSSAAASLKPFDDLFFNKEDAKTLLRGYIQVDLTKDTSECCRDPSGLSALASRQTPKWAVFAGSVQLLAGIKLCTRRVLTNHPQYKDKALGDRT